MSELDLHELFHRLRKRLGMIVVITLLSTIIAGVVSVYFISPLYEAKIGIIIGKEDTSKETTSSDITMYQSLMETYKSIAMTNNVAVKASSNLKTAKPEELLDRTTVTTETGTMIMNIAVRSEDARSAYLEVGAYGEAFIERAKELMPDGEVTIMDSSDMPTMPVSPNVRLNIVVGFAIGLMGSVGLALLFEHLNNTIVSLDDVERTLGLAVIGVIPEREDD